MIKYYCFLLIFNALIVFNKSEATKCKPYSKFKIDCNDCMCSSDGTQYSCTDNFCAKPPSAFHFDDDAFTLSDKSNRNKRDNTDDVYMVDDAKRAAKSDNFNGDDDDIYLVDDGLDGSRAEREASRGDDDDGDRVILVDDINSRYARDADRPMIIIPAGDDDEDDDGNNRDVREVYVMDDEDGERVARDAEEMLIVD